MDSKSNNKRGFGIAVAAVIIVLGGLGVGAYALLANHGRQQQLHDDEVGRQRGVVLSEMHSKSTPATKPSAP